MANGNSGCPCAPPVWPDDVQVDCPETMFTFVTAEEFADFSYCLAGNVAGTTVTHQPTYGASCMKHFEPGSSDCMNLDTGNELAIGERECWCDEVWCYVDPCNCNSDHAASIRFG